MPNGGRRRLLRWLLDSLIWLAVLTALCTVCTADEPVTGFEDSTASLRPISRAWAYGALIPLHTSDELLLRAGEGAGTIREANPLWSWATPRERLLLRAGATLLVVEGARYASTRGPWGRKVAVGVLVVVGGALVVGSGVSIAIGW